MKEIEIQIPVIQWQETGSEEDPRSRLLAAGLVINGCPMHLEAYALADDDEQRFVDPIFGPEDLGFYGLTSTAVVTVEITGRQYVLVATPHGD